MGGAHEDETAQPPSLSNPGRPTRLLSTIAQRLSVTDKNRWLALYVLCTGVLMIAAWLSSIVSASQR